jgi:hypothetical protein
VRPAPKNKKGEGKWQAYTSRWAARSAGSRGFMRIRGTQLSSWLSKRRTSSSPPMAHGARTRMRMPLPDLERRAVRSACYALCVPFARTHFTLAHPTLRLAFSLAGSKVKGAAAPLSSLSTNALGRPRRSRASPADTTPLALPAVPAALCSWQRLRSSQPPFAWRRQCPCSRAPRQPTQHALGRVCRRARRWRGAPARLMGARFAICDRWG